MKSPLLVVLVRLGAASESEIHAVALRETFSGAPPVGSVMPARELLQAGEFREFDVGSIDRLPVEFGPLLASAERALVVVLDTQSGGPPAGALSDVERRLLPFLSRDGQAIHVLLNHPGSLFESAGDPRVLRLGLDDLEERDLRVPFLILHSLRVALQLFAAAPASAGAPRKGMLFFSHAKRDGVPLTTAAKSWLSRLKGFTAYYDTEDLDLDGDIDAQLQNAVADAIVIVFRSDIFDQRYWCQKEVLWAEKHGRPVITVDARWQIEYSPSLINFDSTPVVRIPDGSVVRIMCAALIEGLRIALFRSRAEIFGTGLGVDVAVIPRCPSLVSLHEACATLQLRSSSSKPVVVYPNPALPETLSMATEALAAGTLPGVTVRSLDELRLMI